MAEFPDKSGMVPPAPEKKIDPIVLQGTVVKVKRPATRRFLEFVFAESPKVIAARVARDVVWPRAKMVAQDSINNFVQGMLWGNGTPPAGIVQGTVLRSGASLYHNASNVSGLQQAMAASQARQDKDYQDLRFQTLGDAEKVLANLFALFNTYRRVAIGDLNDIVGLTSKPSDNSYGWTSLEGARISQDRGGFLLELPRPTLL